MIAINPYQQQQLMMIPNQTQHQQQPPIHMMSSSMKLNINDIHREIHEKKMKKIAVYDKMLDKCHKKILDCVKRDVMQMFFTVPEFSLDIMSYDMKMCTVYLIKNLRENGFYVKFYYPQFIFISWDPLQIEKISQKSVKTIDTVKQIANSNTTRSVAFPFKNANSTAKESGKYVLHMN